MLRGYRGIVLALAGLIIIGSGLGYGLVQEHRYQQEAQHRRSDYARHAADQVRQSCGAVPAAQKPKCFKDGDAEYQLKTRDNQREYADLVAQKTSALWTAIMGIAALLGMLLSAIGVLLVWTTFQETKRTNLIAMRENARSTRRTVAGSEETTKALAIAAQNAAAAERQVEVAQETADKQLRPYLAGGSTTIIRRQDWDEIDGEHDFAAFRVSFEVENFGNTPAKRVRAGYRFLFLSEPADIKVFPEPEARLEWFDIPPRDKHIQVIPYQLTKGLLPKLEDGTAAVHLFCEVEYLGLTAEPHKLRFILKANKKTVAENTWSSVSNLFLST